MVSDSLYVTGKVVLITGAATGIGRAVTVAFAGRGAQLSIRDINQEAAEETLDLVRRAGAEVLFTRTYVSQEVDIQKLVSATVKRFGRLDCAFKNAGIAPRDSNRKPTAELDTSTFDCLISVDLRGVLL